MATAVSAVSADPCPVEILEGPGDVPGSPAASLGVLELLAVAGLQNASGRKPAQVWRKFGRKYLGPLAPIVTEF